MMKNIIIAIFVLLMITVNSLSAVEIQPSIIPDEISILIAGENVLDLWEQYGLLIESRIAIPSELMKKTDNDQLAIAGILFNEWKETQTMETLIYDSTFTVIPGEYDLEEVVGFFESQYNTSVVRTGDYPVATNPFYIYSIVFDVFEENDSTYLILAFSDQAITRYYQSTKLDDLQAENSEKITSVFDRESDAAILAYIDGDFIDRSQNSASEMATMFAFGGYALTTLIENYALINGTDYMVGYLSEVDIPVKLSVFVYPETGTIDNKIFATTRNTGTYHFPADPIAYTEINLIPDFIFGVLSMMGYTQQWGMTPTQLNQYKAMLSGHFAVAIYSEYNTIQQITGEMPDFIGLIGISDYNTAYVLLNMMLPATLVTVGGRQVMKVETQSLDSAIYFYLDTQQLIIASTEDILTDYFDNLDSGATPLDYIENPNGSSQVFTVYSPNQDVLTQSINQLVQMFFLGVPPIVLEEVYIHMDIPSDKKSIEYHLEIK